MKRNLSPLFSAAFLLAFPVAVYAVDISVDSTSIVRFEQRDIPGSSKQDIQPFTQFLGLDARKLGDGNLSLHLYGWGRADMGDTSYGDSKTDGNLTYSYLQYRFEKTDADIRAGRFFVREGIINEQVDGISARTDLPFGFGLSAFGGATVHTEDLYGENSDGKGDYIAGGRISFRHKGLLELGISGVYEDTAPALVNYVNGTNRKIGADIWLSPHRAIELVGHSSYNTETSEMAEHRYLLNLRPATGLVLSGEYSDQREQSLFYSWAMFSGAAVNPGDKARTTAITASYYLDKTTEIILGYKHYNREIGNADRYGGDMKLSFMDNRLRGGLGYYYLQAGDNFAITGTSSASYHNLRAYVMHDTKTYFSSVEALCRLFDEKIYGEDTAYEAAFSLGYHITPALALSGDISYGKNPDYQDETKGLVRLTYNMTYDNKGEKK